MTTIIQIAIATAFGLFVAWLCERWISLFDDRVTACLFGFIILVFIAFIYDRRQERKRQSSTETTARD